MSPMGTCGGGGVSAAVAGALHFFAMSQCLLNEQWLSVNVPYNGSTFDFIVVGGGTAGATLAARLSANGLFNVLLVEAGPDVPQESVVPGFRDTLKGGPYDWNFTSVNDGISSQGLEGGVQRQPRGKMLGGSGSMNDMVYSRGFPADYDDWATQLGPDWSWSNVLKYFKKTEQLTDEKIINNEELMKYHGVSGEIEVSGFNDTSFETEVFLEAFQELGFELVEDMTYPHRIGVGRFSHTIRNGQRDSSLTGLLKKVKSNITVLTDATVTRVIIENQTAVGVQLLKHNDNFEDVYHFYANKEVILSSGTFNTAKLLMLSGIGPKEHLESLNIEVVKDLPVGDNLHDHVMYLNFIAADKGTCHVDQATQHMNIIKYLYNRSGAYSRSDSMGALYVLNNSLPNTPDFAFYPTCVPQQSQFYDGCISIIGFTNETCSQLNLENEDHELISIAVVLLKPKSRGRVRLNSTDPLIDPMIYSGTFENSADLDGYPEVIDVVKSFTKTKYFVEKNARYVDIKVGECEGLEGGELVKCKARALATSAWHAVGTAAMGSVVDAELRVLGVKGLRVVDASVMPRVVRGNTNAPVIMIAEKAADFINTCYGAE